MYSLKYRSSLISNYQAGVKANNSIEHMQLLDIFNQEEQIIQSIN